MWLPRDERRVLAFYYRKNPNGSGSYSPDDLRGLDLLLLFSREEGSPEDPSTHMQTVEQINIALRNRDLLKYDLIRSGTMRIDLTPEGMRLGRKYNSWFASSGLWFAEYKDHWLWFVLSFLGGIIGVLLVNWFSCSPAG